MRLRVLDFGVDKYGLNAWIFDSSNDNRTNYDKVLFSRTKDAADAVGILSESQWADVKVKIQGGALDGVAQPGDDLLQVAIDFVAANSPVDPAVEGRIVGP